jgi:acetylglutamate kinase
VETECVKIHDDTIAVIAAAILAVYDDVVTVSIIDGRTQGAISKSIAISIIST